MQNKTFQYNLEALRGFVALLVVLSHIIYFDDYLDPNFFPKVLAPFEPWGHLPVLIFFVLSGYVIGISNKQPLATSASIFKYLKKRLVRIYPIYLVAMVLTLLVLEKTYSLSIIISNLTLTQVMLAPVIWENTASWSLHYEILFYLLFIPVSFFKLNPLKLALVCIGLGIGYFFIDPYFDFPVITAYFFGFAFWLAGLIITRFFPDSVKERRPTQLVAMIFLILCLKKFNLFTTVFKLIETKVFHSELKFTGKYTFYEQAIAFVDLSFIPYCILLILIFTGRRFKYLDQIILVMLLMPLYTFVFILGNYNNPAYIKDMPFIFVMAGQYLICLVLYYFKSGFLDHFSAKIVQAGIWLGGISYAIYILHFPLLILFKQVDLFSGSPVTFWVRSVVFFSILIFFSFILEKKFQPWVSKTLGR